MGKSLPTTTTGFKNFARIISSDRNQIKPPSKPQIKPNFTNYNNKSSNRVDSAKLGLRMENPGGVRVPLSAMVSDCVSRWFNDTLKEARNGDVSMQVLVGQMYNSGYGVRRDIDKGRAWISRASRSRSSAWGIGNKQPGYNASDSDSEDLEDVKS